MPFVAGIAVVGQYPGSPISVEILSDDDEDYNHSFEIKMSGSLQTSFEKLSSAIPVKLEQITLSIPSFHTAQERESAVSTAKAAGLHITRMLDNIQTVQRGLSKDEEVEESAAPTPRNELVLEIGLFAATARLMHTSVVEGVRTFDVIKEVFVLDFQESGDPTALITHLVNPCLSLLKTHPTSSGSRLHRIVVIDSSPNVAPILVGHLELKFHHSTLEILVESSLAQNAAAISLSLFRESIVEEKFVYNVAPLRVGIAKADGFVLTLIPRNDTLPKRQTALLTTSTEGQTHVTINVVVGVSPRVEDNTIVAELVLNGLAPRPKGVSRIRVTVDVEQMGKAHIVAEEVPETGEGSTRAITHSTEVELVHITGDKLTWDEVTNILSTLSSLKEDEEVRQAEDVWAGKEVQGALPV